MAGSYANTHNSTTAQQHNLQTSYKHKPRVFDSVMKFGVEWSDRMANLQQRGACCGSLIPNGCIDYRSWKKRIKFSTVDDRQLAALKHTLELQISAANKTFIKCLSDLLVFQSSSPVTLTSMVDTMVDCFRHRPTESISCDWGALHEYTCLFQKTVYKLCKRIDKRAHLDGAMVAWFRARQTTRMYAVLSSHAPFRRLIELRSNTVGDEYGTTCPICLDDGCAQLIILLCGHVICKICVLQLVGAPQKRGRLQNIIDDAVYHSTQPDVMQRRLACPMCREPYPFACFLETDRECHTVITHECMPFRYD